MNHLHRELAPVSDRAWAEIRDEARSVLRQFMAARKLVELDGPAGWEHDAVPTGRTEELAPGPHDGVTGRVRRVQPLVELRASFELARRELEAVDRGADDPDLEPVADAARRVALAEDAAVFDGYAAGGIDGIASASPHEPIRITDDYEDYPSSVAKAVAKLKFEGVEGPYAIALGPRCYQGVVETTQRGGYPVFEHVRHILDGPIVWAPSVNGAVVISQRGGDFELTLGQDVSIGYLSHDDDTVRLYLEESMTFRAIGPEAGIALRYDDTERPKGRRGSLRR
ncbi:family 1 encapsulin nanocompartment shell protein [Actinomarinicola tropica]|uniref:Type 1 encapsulin shell protein n=1 Tax=Actinomarinicola tropica TaxID=2789776 RepID=A0A5Q2RJD9_9ACTN|nr:family 1 encapsulin nanocompartment shell protein [Actinomarinicola tropica]QGG94506.1 bacteriocin [Actinomarinicola tropica]